MSSTLAPDGALISTRLLPLANDSFWSNQNSSLEVNGSYTTSGPPLKTIEDYTLFQVIRFLSSHYLWVVMALGVPGNIASIFTIVSMPTISSSKVNIALYGSTNGLVTQVCCASKSARKHGHLGLANGSDVNDLRQLVPINERAQHRYTPPATIAIAAHPLAVNE